MQVSIKNRAVRYSLMGLELFLFFMALAWVTRTYIAQRVASTNDTEHLQLAIKLDPDNAEYHLRLGRLYEYVPAEANFPKAMEEFRRAAELNPDDPQVWVNLAAAAEFSGRTHEAESYLRRADFLAPRIPEYQWAIGNFLLLHANLNDAFPHLKMALAGTRKYDQVIFDTAWKASGDPDFILHALIPLDLQSEFSYLDYLKGHQHFQETRAVWQRILSSPGKFSPQDSSSYIDSLINAHDSEGAFEVWTDLRNRGMIPFSSAKSRQDLITDGDFEEPLLNMGFGWRIAAEQDVYAGLDESTYHSPGHSLLVQFTGKENVNYRNVFQYVKVEPMKTYQLRAFLKTEGITTDSGPRLEVRDAYEPALLNKSTESLTGTTVGWAQEGIDFETGPKTELVVVSLIRLPSQKLDNFISGSVWLDDVKLIQQ